MKKQFAAIDILKFICALLVVAIHTAPLMDISEEANFFIVQILARLAVPFFFIISGFFAFSHIDFSKDWKASENIAYLKKYLLRVLKLYVVWTIIYFPLTLRDGMQSGFNVTFVLRYVRDFLLNGSYYHLWYLPGLIFAVAFIYFLFFKLGKRRTFITVITLYCIGSLYNLYSAAFMDNAMIALYDSLFSTTRNGLFFGSIFVFLGAVLAKTEEWMDKKTCFIAGVISFSAMIIEVYVLKSFGFMHALASMYLFLVPTIFFFFQYLLQLQLPNHPMYQTLRAMSLLIYVSHILFVVIYNLLMPSWNALWIYTAVVISCCIFAYVIIKASDRIKFLKNLY